jgi:signal recognition particle GTPase
MVAFINFKDEQTARQEEEEMLQGYRFYDNYLDVTAEERKQMRESENTVDDVIDELEQILYNGDAAYVTYRD